ncbi:WDR37 family protein [Megaselia abdita]
MHKSGRLSTLTDEFFIPEDAPFKSRLHTLFGQIEKEFELLYLENLSLQEKIDTLATTEKDSVNPSYPTDEFDSHKKIKSTSFGGKLKTSHKIKAQTSKIVSSFKTPSVGCAAVRDFGGHKDGVWHVSTKPGQPLIASASADHTSCIWDIDSGRCLLVYQGHSGSVNSVKFHPTKDLVLSSSGDGSAHIWQAAVDWESCARKGQSSDTDAELDDNDEQPDHKERIDTLRTPLCDFSGPSGHSAVVVAADWVYGMDQIITGSWDRTALLWDVETKEVLLPLTGHDHELTHVNSHPNQKLVITASRDTTFRLWDFRDQIPSVSVFQGHTE